MLPEYHVDDDAPTLEDQIEAARAWAQNAKRQCSRKHARVPTAILESLCELARLREISRAAEELRAAAEHAIDTAVAAGHMATDRVCPDCQDGERQPLFYGGPYRCSTCRGTGGISW